MRLFWSFLSNHIWFSGLLHDNFNFFKATTTTSTTTSTKTIITTTWSLACSSNPCQNNGTCYTNNATNTYNCTCPDGYQGLRCQLLFYFNIGCFYDGGTFCGVFVESLTSEQCSSATSTYSVSCSSGCSSINIYYVYSTTVDLCLQICTNYGYRYAGLSM